MKSFAKSRVAEFAVAAAIIVAVVVCLERTAWRRLASLRPEFDLPEPVRTGFPTALKAEALQLHLAGREGAAAHRAALDARLQSKAANLERWLGGTNHADLPAPPARLLTETASALRNYLRAPQSPAALDRLAIFCDQLEAANQATLRDFRATRTAALDSLQRILFLSLLLVAVAGAVVVAVFYQRLLAPLRLQLSENRVHLERQEKLASLGVLATGIAHEIRNPLTAIKVRLFSLRHGDQTGASREEDVRVISDEINRLERIVSDFLQFARPAEPELQPLEVARLLEEIRCLLQPQLARKSVQLVLEAAPETRVNADPQMLKQVLINLVHNAAQSIAGAGTVTLRVRRVTLPLLGRLAEAVAVEVADTGQGMPPEVVRRLFDPFFTTKEDGTGLGLPIAARIIEKHGGVIDYETHLNRGTTFRVILPRAPTHETTVSHTAHRG